MKSSQRSQQIAPFHVMALLERAQQLEAAGEDVIHLEVGEPDFSCPEQILSAGRRALDDGQTRYSPAAGLMPLRQRIADYYLNRFEVEVAPERIIVTPGASGALQLALSAVMDVGDGVLMTDPGYPCNRHFVQWLGGQVQALPVNEDWSVTAKSIAQHWCANTRAVVLASPDNPTGSVLSAAQLSDIHHVVSDHKGTLILDEIYQGLVYDQPAHTLLSQTDQAIVINSFSKFFGMTGWRLGWLVAPVELVPAIERMAQNFFLAPSTVAQHAAMVAFDDDVMAELEQRRQALAQRRDFLIAQLPQLGFNICGQPQGAFYLYCDVSGITDDSFEFCQQLLEQAHVAMTPGRDFGDEHGPHRYLRIAYTADVDRLEQALKRIQTFIASR